MTVVNINVKVPVNGSELPAEGALRWAPSGRRIGTDGSLVLPSGFYIDLVGGAAVVDVEPSDGLWAWGVTEIFTGQRLKRRFFAVPAEGPVNYTDLIEVDPVTLDAALTVTPDPDNPGLYLIGA